MNQKEGNGKKNKRGTTYRTKSLVRMLDTKLLIKNPLYLCVKNKQKNLKLLCFHQNQEVHVNISNKISLRAFIQERIQPHWIILNT